jgi:alpha-glucosidase/alpha-D-xyloside xylohydrolase
VTDEYSGELYVRWFEYSVFNPLFRSHGRHSFLHTPWGWRAESLDEIPDEANLHLAPNMCDAVLPDHRVEPICKRYVELRYRLVPYIYTLARRAHDTGVPFMRPMWFSFPHDEKAATCDSQYMFGDALLVNPVTRKGAREWTTYLPKGQWYDFFSHDHIEGGREVTRAVGLEDIPVYVPAGTLLPMGEVKQHIGDVPINPLDDPITIYLYEGEDASFVLYEDDGITKDYMQGQATYTSFTWDEKSKELSVSGKSSQIAGESRTFRVIHVSSGEEDTATCLYGALGATARV